MDPYIGEIRIFGGTFAPLGWMFCQGQILQISEYTEVYALFQNTFGGDGVTTFALPDLRGRVPIHPSGPIQTTVQATFGQTGGNETHTLTISEMPTHNHGATVTVDKKSIKVSSAPNSTDIPTAGASLSVRGGTATDQVDTFNASAPNTIMNGATITPPIVIDNKVAGGSQPHENMQPWIALNYIIAVMGIWPSQN